MNRNPAPQINNASQRGAALIVSLIVLLVVTLLGLSSMESALMQERMASNSQNENLAFQASESLLEDSLRDDDIFGGAAVELSDAINRGVGESGPEKSFSGAASPVSANYQVVYMGENPPFVTEGQETSMGGDIPLRRYEITMSTKNAETQAGATHTQGIIPN